MIYFGNGVIKTQETLRETEAEGEKGKLDEPLQRPGCNSNGKERRRQSDRHAPRKTHIFLFLSAMLVLSLALLLRQDGVIFIS